MKHTPRSRMRRLHGPAPALAWLLGLVGALGAGLAVTPVSAADAPAPPRAAIASAHPLATAAGTEILAAGGNAFDAAVAVSAALGVVEPTGSGLGGGGFWLLHRASDGYQVVVDGRETAPSAATADMYLDENGKPVPRLSRDGPLAAGIPGQAAALEHLAAEYGRLPLAQSLAPAIRLARDGFPVSERLAAGVRYKLDLLTRWPAAAAVYAPDGEAVAEGDTLRQADLARTLAAIAEAGAGGFYRGPVAELLVKANRSAGGIWTLEDLAAYRIREREPVYGEYHGMRVVSAPPPSSGGVLLINALNILAGFPLDDVDSATAKHLVVESMRRSFRDRAEYLGDPDFVDMPMERLLHPYYAAGQRAAVRFDRATPSDSLPGILPADFGGGMQTTHFSVLDREGNRVAGTMSINFWFGSGFMAPGTGVLLNNEMDDFSVKPGVPNGYQLVGAEANAVAPGKRMLSSMTPTFLESDEGIAILGTPGGSRIISMVLLATLARADGADAAEMASLARYHHQYLPDRILYEPEALTEAEREALQSRGHELRESRRRYGNMNVITWDYGDDEVQAASDPRGEGVGRIY